MKTQVMDMVREQISETFEVESMELWTRSEKRELLEWLDIHQFMMATAHMIEHNPDAELKKELVETEILEASWRILMGIFIQSERRLRRFS